jgi:hypothetical protein
MNSCPTRWASVMCRKVRRAGPMRSACALVVGATGAVDLGVVDADAGLVAACREGGVRCRVAAAPDVRSEAVE